jgi:mannose-6-phosphate isomerase-like protein (cupin superfamily)
MRTFRPGSDRVLLPGRSCASRQLVGTDGQRLTQQVAKPGAITNLNRTHQIQRTREFLLGEEIRFTVLVSADETGGRFDLLDGYKAPGAMSPLHLHERYEERVWVVSGELEVWAVDQHRVRARATTSVAPGGGAARLLPMA